MSCKTINIDLANVPPVPIPVGVAGENSFRTITFDASKWGADYPDATYTVVYRRSDGYLYPVLVNASADAIVWNPTEIDTAVSGNGQLEVRLLDGETIGKTIIMQTYVAPSLSGDESEPSTPAPDWVNDVAEDADRAEAAVSHYPKIINGVWYVWDAEQSDFVSTGISAQGEDGVSPTVTVTAIEGGHRVTITDADGAHTFDVMDGEGGSGGGAVESVNGMTGAVVLGAADVGAVSAETYATDMAGVRTELIGKLSVGDLATALDDVGGITYVLAINGATVTLDRPFVAVANSLLSTARRVMFVVILAESGGNPVEFLSLTPTLLDKNNRLLTLVGEHNGSRYTAKLTAASLSSTMTGTLVVEPIVTQSDIPTAVSDLANDSGFQTASDVQTAIAAAAELPTVTASDNGKFLRVVNGAWAAETVPAAESNSFGGGA